MNFDLKKPCADCPFKNDKPYQKGWLGRERAIEIAETLVEKDQTFQCHKTLDLGPKKHQHCAGATIMLEHMGKPNQMMRIMERIGSYDPTKVDMENEAIFKDAEDFIEWHTK